MVYKGPLARENGMYGTSFEGKRYSRDLTFMSTIFAHY